MRWLIAFGLMFGLAGAAHAQSPTEILCARYDDAWGKVAGGSDVRQMRSVERTIPAICPVKTQAGRRIAQLEALQPKKPVETENPSTEGPAALEPEVEGPSQPETPPPAPAAPVDPCSSAGIDAQDPGIPADGPDPGLPVKKRQDLAERYARRAQAYQLCHDPSDALAYYNIAVKEDPQNYTVIAARAEFHMDQRDYQDAIADYGSAIALKDNAPPDVNILTEYANRATAYAVLKMYPEEIADLKMVVDHFNDALHDTLKPFDVYKERLAKAYYEDNDTDDAEAMMAVIDDTDLDWEDLAFLGRVSAEGKIWDKAIEAMTKSLAAMPRDAALRRQKSRIEAALGQAYQARAQLGDQRSAWDAYQAAVADDPGNADAKAGIASLGTMPPPPTFQEPALDTVVMPAGITDLVHDNPALFCNDAARNDYLDTIKSTSNTVNSNMSTLGLAIDALLQQRKVYDASILLSYAEKIQYLRMFDQEWKKLDTENTQLRATGDALVAFFARVRDDEKLVGGNCVKK